MQSCTVTPETGGKQQGVRSHPEVAFSAAGAWSSFSACCCSASSPVSASDTSRDRPTLGAEKRSPVIPPDDVRLPRDTPPCCTDNADTIARSHSAERSFFLSDTGIIQGKSCAVSNDGSAFHDGGNTVQSVFTDDATQNSDSAVDTHISGVGNKATDPHVFTSSGGHGRGEMECRNNEVCGVSPSGGGDNGNRRNGLLFFCSSDKYADKADSGSSTSENSGDADPEESVQPRNFFPFNNLFAAAGWGSAGGWFFSNSGLFTAADVSSDITAEEAGSGTAEQAPAGVYLARLPAMPPSRSVLPLLSIGSLADTQKNVAGEQENVQKHGASLTRASVESAVLLTPPWHQQERRHREQVHMKYKRRRIDVLARAPVSGRNAGLQKRSSVTGLQPSAETRLTGNSRTSSMCLLTKSVGYALWSCLCKLLRSRFSLIKNAAATAAVSKAAKKISRAPGLFRLFKETSVGFALQDFSVRDVVRQWISSLLLCEKQISEKPVFVGPAQVNRFGRAAAAGPKEHLAGEHAIHTAELSCSSLADACAAKAHVFITPEAGRVLWRSACSLILNPLTAMYFQCYRLASLGTIVYVTSVVHWWQPQLGVRRTVDVLAVCVVSGIHVVVACVHAALPVLLLYMFLCCAGVFCYILGCSLAFQGLHEEAAVCHVGLHALCTIANLLLYYTIAE